MRKLLIAGVLVLTGGTFYSALWHKSEKIEGDITARVGEALAAEGAQDVAVDVDGRHVTLSGIVFDSEQEQSYLQTADETYGALGPIDGLVYQADTGFITAQKTADGITLSGTVPNEDERAALVEAAQAATDGAVVDALTVAGPDADWQDEARFGLTQLSALSVGTLTASAGALSLSGVAGDAAAVNDAVSARDGWSAFVSGRTQDEDAGQDDEIARLRGVVGNLSGQLASRNGTIGTLTNQLEDRDATIGSLNGQLASRIGTTGGFRNDLADRDAAIGSLNGQLASRNGTIGTLTNQLEDRDATIGSLNGQLASRIGSLAGLRNDLADRDATIGSLNGQLASRNGTIGALNSQLADIDGATGNSNVVPATGNGSNEELINQLAERDRVIGSLNGQLASRIGTIGGLRGQLADRDRVIGSLNGQLASRIGTVGALTNQLEDRDAAIGSLNGQLASRNGTIGTLTNQLEDRDATIGSLNGQLASRIGSLAGLRNDLADRDAAIGSLNGQLASRVGSVGGLRSQLADRDEVIGSLNGQLASRIGTIGALESQLSERDETIASLQAQPTSSVVANTQQCAQQATSALEGQRINFAVSTATIERESVELLERLTGIALACVGNGLTVEIGGHTDAQGSDEDNQILSEARARAIADFMTARGVPANGLSAVGYGEVQPIADNETSEGRAANRRISFDWQAQ